ncbi:MAG TPA: TonB family protein, partial [Sphingomicrobium sp.]|nr:TonB family protein [Sphingomicrobium sp.]
MSSYTGTADRPDQAKAVAAVVAVHVALAAAILTGLNVRMVGHAVEVLKTFNIREPPPPPPEPPPPPQPKPKQAKLDEGAAGRMAKPTPVVAPKPRIPVPSPIPAAPIAGTGSATRSGAANYGTGPGAGGAGNGFGGGDFSRFTPARRITRIPDREYRGLAATGLQSGSVGVTIKVNPDGSVSNCRVARSSGNSYADGLMCQLTLRYIRFSPARDA